MKIEYGFDAAGGFVVRDVDGRWASYSYPSSPNAAAARKSAARVARKCYASRESDLRQAATFQNARITMEHKREIRLISTHTIEVAKASVIA